MTDAAMKVIAECPTYDVLHSVLRKLWQERQISAEALDDLSGVQTGYSAKVLGPNPSKRLGPISWSILTVLGVKLVVVEDAKARASMESRFVPKREVRSVERPGLTVDERVKAFFSSTGAAGGRARKERLSPRRRSQIARRAARARWAK